MHRPGGEGEGQGLVGELGVEGEELRVRGVDEDADAPGVRRATDALDHQEHAQHEHDASDEQDDRLGEHDGEPGEPLDCRGEELEPGKVRAHGQGRVVREQGMSAQQLCERGPVQQLVEAVEDERAAQDVGDEHARTEDHRDADALAARGGGAREAPRGRHVEDDETNEEQGDGRAAVTRPGQRVGDGIHEHAEGCHRRDRPKARRAGRGTRRTGGGVAVGRLAVRVVLERPGAEEDVGRRHGAHAALFRAEGTRPIRRGATRRAARAATPCAARVAAKSEPATKRSMGPKLAAAASPTK